MKNIAVLIFVLLSHFMFGQNNSQYPPPPYKFGIYKVKNDNFYNFNRIDSIENFGVIHTEDTTRFYFRKNSYDHDSINFYYTVLEINADNEIHILFPAPFADIDDCYIKFSILDKPGNIVNISTNPVVWSPPYGQNKLIVIYSTKPISLAGKGNKGGSTLIKDAIPLQNLVLSILSGNAPEFLKDCYFDIFSLEVRPQYYISDNTNWGSISPVIPVNDSNNTNSSYNVFYNVYNLAISYEKRGNYVKAEEFYLKSLEIFKQSALEETHVEGYALILNNLGAFYQNIGYYDKAEFYLINALKLTKSLYGEIHPDHAAALNNLAFCYKHLGIVSKSEMLFIESIEIYSMTFGENSPEYATALNNLIDFYSDIGNYKKVDSLYKIAYKIKTSSLGGKTKTDICPYEEIYIKCPNITILNPLQMNNSRGGETIPIKTKKYVISGTADCKNGVEKILVNQEEAKLTPVSGSSMFWEKEVSLVEGKNKIHIDAVSPGGGHNERWVDLDFKIDTSSLSKTGKNYLVVIGINNYRSWTPLNTAVGDAEAVKKALLDRYNFSADHTFSLTDSSATQANIDGLMRQLISTVGEYDNILIYFAGHGHYDELMNEGYWIPVDGKRDTPSTYLSNSTIYKYLQNFKARHTLVIADACFSGSFYIQGNRADEKDRYKDELYQSRSKWVFSSGMQEKVADVQYGTGHSPFANYLLKVLSENKNDLLVGSLVEKVSTAVANNSKQIPIGKPIQGAGDEGGQFVFELKK